MNETKNWPKITKDTTIEELKEIHKRIWLYAAEHGEKPDTPYNSNCVLCEWDTINEGTDCSMCPYKPKDENEKCLDGLYNKWLNAADEEVEKIALQIANIEIVDRRNDYA